MARGYGQKAQDWSYLTPKRALYTQSVLITDPALIPEAAIIDTTQASGRRPTERARHQTLVIYCTAVNDATITDSSTARLFLWLDSEYDEKACGSPPRDLELSSSSNWGCDESIPDDFDGSVTKSNRWALLAVAAIDNATALTGSLCFSFPWLPAGRYKAAIGVGTIANDVVLISEQHTE